MFEYANGRFLNPARLIAANIYKKQNGIAETNGQPLTEIRVAIDLANGTDKPSCVYAGPYASEEEARKFIQSMPVVS